MPAIREKNHGKADKPDAPVQSEEDRPPGLGFGPTFTRLTAVNPHKMSDDYEPTQTTAAKEEERYHRVWTPRDVSNTHLTCFRIYGIPAEWDKRRLNDVLRNMEPDLDVVRYEISELFPACWGTTQVALLDMQHCPTYFSTFERNEERAEIVLEPDRTKVWLALDRHFHDLTPMNRPTEPIIADVFVLTGLEGHAVASFRSRSSTGSSFRRPMWLSDFLPLELPEFRIMTFGYDGSLSQPNGYDLTDYRRTFIECLQIARVRCKKRPMIFIGHNLGGILAVQTLLELMKNDMYKDLRGSLQGMFFFGTPHRGMRTVELGEIADQIDDNMYDQMKVQELAAQLCEGSDYLENQSADLKRVWSDFPGKVFSFYETEKTKFVKELGGPGGSVVEDCGVHLVHRTSAQLGLPGESCIPVSSNNADMVKFESSQNTTFQTLVRGIKECVGLLVESDDDDEQPAETTNPDEEQCGDEVFPNIAGVPLWE